MGRRTRTASRTRLDCSLSVPIAKFQWIKLAYSRGTTTRRGTDLDTLNLTWQLAML